MLKPRHLSICLLLIACAACGGSMRFESNRHFGTQLAFVSPHDEPGGRFDGARLSPGVGILYLNGYTREVSQNEACGGFLADEPEHILEVGYAMSLKLVAESEHEIVMALKGEAGDLICWDADSQSNANVSLTTDLQPGTYNVWVGSTRAATSSAYRLVLSE